MTDENFTELVDLYLDKEICESDLMRLRAELSTNAQRRKRFAERVRLHRAMQMALNPQLNVAKDFPNPPHRAKSPVSMFSWFMGTGLAACLAFGVVLLATSRTDRAETAASSVHSSLTGGPSPDILEEVFSGWSSEAELKRYALRQQQGLVNERASLAAQLRLMGLRPELIPQDKELRAVNLAALQSEPTRSQAELLTALQRHSVMPQTRILRFDAPSADQEQAEAGSYGNGFQSSLISFR